MKKIIVCVLAALAIGVLLQPQMWERFSPEQETQRERENQPQAFEAQLGVKQMSNLVEVTLYFRFAGLDVLGASRAQLDMRREETVASSIVRQLIEGPDVSHDKLSGVFPQGTALVSVVGHGETAFVTLTRHFLGRPDGAPSDWEDLSGWQEEAALRRRLAFQSIVLALTEDGRFQRVQLYVADSDDDIPQRIPMYYFDTNVKDPNLLLAACARDEEAMLSPHRAMELILKAWQEKNWEGLYAFLLQEGAGGPMPLSAFEAKMRETAVSLLEYETTAGTVSLDGRRATVVLDAQIRSELGGDAQIERQSVQLVRQADNWTIGLDALMGLMIRD